MDGGTVFAGMSPDTKKPMYAAPADAPLIDGTVYAAAVPRWSAETLPENDHSYMRPVLRCLGTRFVTNCLRAGTTRETVET